MLGEHGDDGVPGAASGPLAHDGSLPIHRLQAGHGRRLMRNLPGDWPGTILQAPRARTAVLETSPSGRLADDGQIP